MSISTSVTDRLGITHPVILAPMGGVAGGRLAAAVSEAGGLGIIGGGYGDPRLGYGGRAFMDEQFRAAGNARVGVGYITWALAKSPDLLEQALDRRPAAIILSFGEERQFADAIRKAGVPLICQVQDVAGARRAADAGADIIVAQGTEAGGHGKLRRATLALVPAVVGAVAPVPVVAAGGIGDGRGLAAALMLGASAVLVGTRFWATPEALGPETAKRRLVEATGDDTIRTRVFDIVRDLDWPEDYTGRAIANDFTGRWHGRDADLARQVASARDSYWTAARAGDVREAVVFAGEGLDMIRDVTPAAEMVRGMCADAEALLRSPPHVRLG